jgi:hypothetical protein
MVGGGQVRNGTVAGKQLEMGIVGNTPADCVLASVVPPSGACVLDVLSF